MGVWVGVLVADLVGVVVGAEVDVLVISFLNSPFDSGSTFASF